MSFQHRSNPLSLIGVVADTHVPDRVKELDPRIPAYFRAAGVKMILHAGDISSLAVIESLKEIAPVIAVRGNRDLLIWPNLPMARELTVGGVKVCLTHGHRGWVHYLVDKFFYVRDGYSYERYRKPLLRLFPKAQVIVFGHTHHVEIRREADQLVFNPGCGYPSAYNDFHPSVGLLSIFPNQKVEAEVTNFTE
jgi:putative phosphoesterase